MRGAILWLPKKCTALTACFISAGFVPKRQRLSKPRPSLMRPRQPHACPGAARGEGRHTVVGPKEVHGSDGRCRFSTKAVKAVPFFDAPPSTSCMSGGRKG